MKVPASWLAEHCDPGWEPGELAVRLAMTGTEVERVGHQGPPSDEGYVIGYVSAAEKHPDADRLKVCQVDTGEGEPRTIVCGAPNVEAGQFVAVAKPGALLPGGQQLKQATLRGVLSDGMILSETELQIGDESDGIAVLAVDGDAEPPVPGSPLSSLVPVAEPVLELELTPNRVDCFAIYGVAREVHAISGAELGPAPWEPDAEPSAGGAVNDLASVTVEAPELCPRFTARAFLGVTIGPSPLWLKQRLSAAGQRPINNVVDITNYVMLLTGQPLHAFDLDKVPNGELIVRTAVAGEKMTTLDGVERVLDVDTVLVCDADGPSGIAGIMGGQRSEVSASTTRVLLEVATWDGPNILRTSRKLGLRSEASSRFEKQLSPELAMRAQAVASRLLIDLAGAELVPGTIDVGPTPAPPRVVSLHLPQVERLVGMAIDAGTCAERLERLGFGVSASGDQLQVTVPPERSGDIEREVDLIEEVARLADLDANLPSTLPEVATVGGLSRPQALRRRAEDVACDLGFDEIVGWSFNDPALADRLRLEAEDPRRAAIEVANPLSGDQSVMRTTLLGSLLDAARLNLSRGSERVALFESGRVYLRAGEPAIDDAVAGAFQGRRPAPAFEPHRLGALLSGSPAASWRAATPEALDFYALKGMLEAVCDAVGSPLTVQAAPEPFLHPGRSAVIEVGGRPAGWIGELHPLVARAWDLSGATAFELDMGALIGAAKAGEELYADLTTFPAVSQDIAIVVPAEVSAAAVREAVVAGAGELLQSARVFDLYRGEQLGEGRKSLALRLEFQAVDRTLTEAEVSARRASIADALVGIGGSLRE